jgi:hypothetical protein
MSMLTQHTEQYEEWHNEEGALHREDGPAVTRYDKDRIIIEEQWWFYGEKTLTKQPAYTGEGQHEVSDHYTVWRKGQPIESYLAGEVHRCLAPLR